ncbi:hypothetical protein GCM10009790_19630 [Georgenia ruanii]
MANGADSLAMVVKFSTVNIPSTKTAPITTIASVSPAMSNPWSISARRCLRSGVVPEGFGPAGAELSVGVTEDMDIPLQLDASARRAPPTARS